ncbi:hypothetical protein [Streptomyces afghaniensis]|uniref:hypothetical protein n=1 Tax=Streptomyces afghaniensis TaxID=66865 RepID=UPI002789F6EC|nr:hypothetical protein [Streptomyces afghaniensis]MDQ1021901.1 hypothetical protein [Streptomyces afghaniensis]
MTDILSAPAPGDGPPTPRLTSAADACAPRTALPTRRRARASRPLRAATHVTASEEHGHG